MQVYIELLNMKIFLILRSMFYIIFSKKFDHVFYSESEFYQKYFITLITGLSNNSEKIIYLSSEINDVINDKNVRNFYIGNGILLYFTFLIINAKNLIFTVPDLGNNQIKKTKNIDNYIYLFHASNSVHKQFTKDSFKNYDVIFCNGQNQTHELKYLENHYKIKKKLMINSGYLYFDYLKNVSNISLKSESILIAPSWNYNKDNFFTKTCSKLIKQLLIDNFKVILRPHPEHYKRYKKTIDLIKKENKNNNNFTIDYQPENIDSMNKAKVLITDCSGIAPEYLFTYKRPVIYFDDYKKIHNNDFDYLDLDVFEDVIKDSFGYRLKEVNIKNIKYEISKAIELFDKKKENVNIFAKDKFYNFQSSLKTHLDFFLRQK